MLHQWLGSLGRRKSMAVSLALGNSRFRWVFGEIHKQGHLHFKNIAAFGGGAPVDPIGDDGLWSSTSVCAVLDDVMNQLPKQVGKPDCVVFCVPSNNAYLGEVVVPRDESDNMIRFRIQDLMEAAAGESKREAAFDWQAKAELPDDTLSLAVAGIDQKQVDEIMKACRTHKLDCLGITLDSVAALNGYLQMAPSSLQQANIRFLLHGELGRQRIRLAVFSQGMLINESWEQNDDGFSVVQAVAALERLVMSWVRDGLPDEVASVRLILGGELMYSKTCESTAQRSQILAPRLLAISPRKEIALSWHDDVVPYGALEAMPCE